MSAIPEHLRYRPQGVPAGMVAPPKRPTRVEDIMPVNMVRHGGKIVWISQSLLKDFALLEAGLGCPKQFWYKYIRGEEVQRYDSGAMTSGKRFEFLLTGQTDKYNNPTPAITTGKGAVSAEETRVKANAEAAYDRLFAHGFRFKRFVGVEGTTISGAKTGSTIRTAGMSGTLDLLCKREGKPCIVDLKYSGLLGDRWNEYGWYWEDETHPNYIGNSAYHRVQATHYTLLYYLRFGKIVPFYYAVFDSRAGKEGNYRIFEMNITEVAMVEHLRRVNDVAIKLRAMLKTARHKECEKNAFCPVGTYDRCQNCLLANKCSKRVTLQEEIKVTI